MGIFRRLGRRLLGRNKPSPPAPKRRAAPAPPPPPPQESKVGKSKSTSEQITQPISAEQLAEQGQGRVVHHWATWCDGCVEELPLVERLHQELLAAGGPGVLGVSWERFMPSGSDDDSLSHIDDFTQEAKVSFQNHMVTTPPEDFFTEMKLSYQQIPQTIVYDESGKIVHHVQGDMSAASLKDVCAAWQALQAP
jgi:thiol-disulfide isomerase/thioredoxin